MNNKLWKKLKLSNTSNDLVVIEKSDYGQDAEKHYAALLDIYENSKMPQLLKWEPHEVVSLTKWSDISEKNKQQTVRVLFCADILLEALKNEENLDYIDGSNQDIIIAIHCANLLGSNWSKLLNDYLQKLYSEVNKVMLGEEVIYFSLGISIVFLLLNQHSDFIQWAEQTHQDVKSIEDIGFFNNNDHILGYTFNDLRLELGKKYLDMFEQQIIDSPINNVLTSR